MSWLQAAIRWHHLQHAPALPPRFLRREYGFIHAEGRFHRHIGFGSEREIHQFLIAKAPLHSYHSTAYYDHPGALKMEDKGWLGADLIFDLDADHLPGGKGKPPWAMLAQVQEELVKLVNDFLIDQLGFDPQHLRVVFSGNRGYHVHVHDPRAQALEAGDRREIVAYVTGLGLDTEHLLTERVEVGRDRRESRYPQAPPLDAPGWRGHIARTASAYLANVAQLPDEEALERLRELPGIGPDKAGRILSTARNRRGDALQAFQTKAILHALVDHAKVLAAGETDEPVTADTKRLIRLPGTLHGKTGLLVREIPLERVGAFDAMREPLALPDEPVQLEVGRKMTIPYGDGVTIEPGPATVPAYAAFPPVALGFAKVVGGWLHEPT